MTAPKFVMSCMNTGPIMIGPDEEMMDISCTRPENHSEQFHRWWSDDGTVKIEWQDEFSFGEAEWRQDMRDDIE